MTNNLKSIRDGFGEALIELGEKNPNVVVVTANLGESTRVEAFAKRFPDRFFEVGVAEQSLVTVAAGMALASIGGFSAGAYFLSRTFVFPYFVLFAVLHCTVLLIQQRLPEGFPRLLQWRRDILIWGTVSTLASVVYIYVSILLLNR